MSDVNVVAPRNIGKGIVWDEATRTYQVKLGKGLYFDANGTIQMRQNTPTVKSIDNGTGQVYHKQAVVDFGGLVKISGVVTLPLLGMQFVNLFPDNPLVVAERNRIAQLYPDTFIYGAFSADPVALGLTLRDNVYPVYYCEAGFELDLSAYNPQQIISASATAGDLAHFRKETAWVINDMSLPDNKRIPIGVHVYYTEGQTEVKVSYSVEFTKG